MKQKLQLIDFERKGHLVRFYLGGADLKTWHGDDWDDTPYEHNAGTVYERFVKKHIDVVFPWDDIIMEPSDGYTNSNWCKEDMIKKIVPCIVLIKNKDMGEHTYFGNFEEALNHSKSIKFYFGSDPTLKAALHGCII